jgi:protein required for attachment to host cells
MQLPKNATVAVADGEKMNLFRNKGDEKRPQLVAVPGHAIDSVNKGSGGRHHSSSANPDDRQIAEDSFAAGIASMLNKEVLEGSISDLVIIAAPRTLGELRMHYHAKLSECLRAEIAKDLTGHSIADIEEAIAKN